MIIKFSGESSESLLTYFANELGGKILIIDTICQERILPIFYKVENEVIFDIYDILNGNSTLDRAKVPVNVGDLIGSSYYEDKIDFQEEDFVNFISEVKELYDHILILANDLILGYSISDGKNIILDKTRSRFSEKTYYVFPKECEVGLIKKSSKELSQRGDLLIGLDNVENDYDLIYRNFIEDKAFIVKNKGIFRRIKEAIFKN